MYRKLFISLSLFPSIFLSCSNPKNDSENNLGFLKKLYNQSFLNNTTDYKLNGIWKTQWKNKEGYLVNEFIFIDDEKGQSFLCVLNPMGGYEYSQVKVVGHKLFTTFINPKKDIYINQLSAYGKNAQDVQLNYSAHSNTLEWSSKIENTPRTFSYTKILPSDEKSFSEFNSTCGQLIKKSYVTTELKTEKLFYNEKNSFVSVLQTSSKGGEHTNFCVYNTNTESVLSLPVHTFPDSSIAFSNLDLLNSSDRAKLFKPVSMQEISNRIAPELLNICSAISKNSRFIFSNYDPFHLEMRISNNNFVEPMPIDSSETPMSAEPTATYLVCKYRNSNNGSNASWEWGEYPKWEWEKQKSSCRGLFASNCLHLNGEWARNNTGLGAIGTMFLMDTTSNVEADFNRACNETNKLAAKNDVREYAQYHVADSSLSFNHTVWFKKTRQDLPYNLPFNRVVAFGDSLSDNGNLHAGTGGIIAAGAYYQGRFSNGPVWVEYLNQKLGLDLYDWAVAAAPSDFGSIFDMFKSVPYTMQNELKDFTASIEQVGMTQDELSKMLFTVLFGGNNFARDVKGTPKEVSDDFVTFISNIVNLGARHIMVINLPDLSVAPKFNFDPAQAEVMRAKVVESNRLIEEKLNLYKAQHPNISFYHVDLFKFTDDVIQNPAKYHITNTTEPCYLGAITGSYDPTFVCENPETYLFWDRLHPATTFACTIADLAVNEIFEKLTMPILPLNDHCNFSYIH